MKETINNLKKVYKFGKKYKWSLIWQVVGCIIGITINIIIPLISAYLIVNFNNSAWEQVIYMAIVLSVVHIVDELKSVLIRKNTQIFRRGTVRNLQMKLGIEILNMEQSDIDSISSGVFIQRITNDTDKMAEMFTTGMGHLTGVISNVGSFIAILIIDYHMFIYYLFAAIILTLFNLIKTKKYGKKDIEYRTQKEKVSGLTGELVRGTRDIKMLYAKKSFLDVFDENIIEQNNRNFIMRNIEINYILLIGLIRSVFEFTTILLLYLLIQDSIISISIGIALYSYKDNVMVDLMSKISNLLDGCKNFNISCDRVFTILDNKTFKKEKFGTKHINMINGDFEFKNVTFSYNGINKVLDNISFKVDANTTVGFVGKSGAGKTTIFSLMCKMYDVQDGEITVDGNDIKELDEGSIRGNITIIGQSPYIFNMSIIDNMKLVNNKVTLKEIENACKMACISDYIETLPEKYNTIIGEQGVNLSGGQKQRLAIARALIQKTEIILFDEATSALDNETQSKIKSAINNMKGKYTILIVAHRLSTIIDCDKILVVDDGKIIATGSHKELLETCKFYKNLYEKDLLNNK